MNLNVNNQIQITGRAAVDSSVARTGDSESHVAGNTGWNLDLDFVLLPDMAGACALVALLTDYFSCSVALRAGSYADELAE